MMRNALFVLLVLCAGVSAVLSSDRASAAAGGSAQLDPGFGERGIVRTKGFAIQRIAEDRRGRIVAIASGTDEFLAARYLPDGRPDRSFGKEGLATVPLTKLVDPGDPGEPEAGYSCCAEVSALRIEPDGGILVAGSYEISTAGSLELSILARLTPNGRLDRSFGEREGREATAGEVRVGALARTEVIALQGGNILLGGKRGVGVVVRLHGNGTFDRGFGDERGGGFITLPMPPPHHPARYSRKGAVTGLLPGPRGSVYVSGDANGDLMLARLRPDGSLDPGFADGGMIRVNGAARRRCLCSVGSGLARDSLGRFLLAGRLGSSPGGLRVPPQLVLARLRHSGDPDRSFGRNGFIRVRGAVPGYDSQVAIAPNGKILLAGTLHPNRNETPYSFAAIRYLPDGSLDPSFYGNGIFKARLGPLGGAALDPLVDRAGRFVVAGGASYSLGTPPGHIFEETETRGLILRFR
jgi:uncharacterized delta-60 repeat protein